MAVNTHAACSISLSAALFCSPTSMTGYFRPARPVFHLVCTSTGSMLSGCKRADSFCHGLRLSISKQVEMRGIAPCKVTCGLHLNAFKDLASCMRLATSICFAPACAFKSQLATCRIDFGPMGTKKVHNTSMDSTVICSLNRTSLEVQTLCAGQFCQCWHCSCWLLMSVLLHALAVIQVCLKPALLDSFMLCCCVMGQCLWGRFVLTIWLERFH